MKSPVKKATAIMRAFAVIGLWSRWDEYYMVDAKAYSVGRKLWHRLGVNHMNHKPVWY